MAVIAMSDGKKMRPKLDTRDRTGTFVGYADDNAGNVYRFINITEICPSRKVGHFKAPC